MNVPGVFKGMFPGRVFLLRGLGGSHGTYYVGGPEWTGGSHGTYYVGEPEWVGGSHRTYYMGEPEWVGGSHGTYCAGEPEGSRAARGGPACSHGRTRVVIRGICSERR